MADEEMKVRHQSGGSRKWTGFILLIIGGILLAQHSGIYFPAWLFNWQMVLIVIGLLIGIHHRFYGPGWFIMVLIGGFFLIDSYYPGIKIHELIWPVILIGVGLVFIFRPHRNRYHNLFEKQHLKAREEWGKWTREKKYWKDEFKGKYTAGEDYIDTVSVFGGVKKNILSKDFQGGEVTNFFGGTELNLSQTDINGRVILEITQVFGGTKLIIPPHWDVRTEFISLFSGVEDKRPLDASGVDPNKVLLLKGISIFGGIDIRSY